MTERDLRVVFGKWGVLESVVMGVGRTDGNALEDAVRGLPIGPALDEDEDDEDDNEEEKNRTTDEDITAQNTYEPRFIGTGGPPLPCSKRARRKPQLPPSVVETIPLPPLNPRSTPFGPSGLRSAHIVFLDAISLSRAMSYSSGTILIPNYGEDPANISGLAYYTRLHASLRPSLKSVKEHADSAMARYDHLHSLLLSSRAKKQGAGALVDEDGFTVVVRGGRYGRTGGAGMFGVAVANKIAATEDVEGKRKKGMGAGELNDFYRFQKVDRQRQGGFFPALTQGENLNMDACWCRTCGSAEEV